MVERPKDLIRDFQGAAQQAAPSYEVVTIDHEAQQAPHEPHGFPPGKCAVYVFSLSAAYGDTCPAGVNRVLKIGKVGPNSNARFQSQHYSPRSAQSTLARSILSPRILWPYLAIETLGEGNVGSWIKQNTDRDNFYLDVRFQGSLPDLERYLRARLGPVFEGG